MITALNTNIKPHVIQAHIPLISNFNDTREEPSALHNSKHTKHTHETWVQNTTLYTQYTVTALHTLNNTVAFDTINTHTLIRKLLQTNIPDTSIKFIVNYMNRCKVYTTHRKHTSSQRQFKTGVPQGGVFHLHYSTFTLQTYHHPEHWFMSWHT